jgi:hypothetical protein
MIKDWKITNWISIIVPFEEKNHINMIFFFGISLYHFFSIMFYQLPISILPILGCFLWLEACQIQVYNLFLYPFAQIGESYIIVVLTMAMSMLMMSIQLWRGNVLCIFNRFLNLWRQNCSPFRKKYDEILLLNKHIIFRSVFHLQQCKWLTSFLIIL